jgi:hypothetical protein
MAWLWDRDEARAIMAAIASADREFVPEGVAAPWRYRLAYRLFGFEGAESIADRIRKFA